MTPDFKVGDRVYWTDPDTDWTDPDGDGTCSGPGVITQCETPNDPEMVVSVLKDDGSEVECYPHELTRIDSVETIAPTRTNAKRSTRKKAGQR